MNTLAPKLTLALMVCASLAGICRLATAANTELDLTLSWKDPRGGTHPLRMNDVDVFDAEPLNNIEILNTTGRLTTDSQGRLLDGTHVGLITIDDDPDDMIEFFAKIHTEVGSIARFETTLGSGIAGSRTLPTGGGVWQTPEGGSTSQSHTFANADLTEKAFSVLQAVKFMHDYYAAAPFSATLPKIDIGYGTGIAASMGGNEMDLGPQSWASWDVLLHEYGHHIAENNNLDFRPAAGLAHSFDEDQITRHGNKNTGTRLAWAEGIATFLGTMAMHTDGGKITTAIPGIHTEASDTFYTQHRPSAASSTINGDDRLFEYDIETRALKIPLDGSGNFIDKTKNEDNSLTNTTLFTRGQGEGDELSVARVLFDVFDLQTGAYNGPTTGGDPGSRSGTADNAKLGAEKSYNLLKGNDTFFESWQDMVPAITGSDAKRALVGLGAGDEDPHAVAQLGATLEEYAISPRLTNTGANAFFDHTPTLSFTEQNSDNSIVFRLLIYDDDWSTLVYDTETDATRITDPNHGSDVINAFNHELASPLLNGTYNWVVLGDPAVSSPTQIDDSMFNWYWSGFDSFQLVPEPSTMVLLLGLAAVGLLNRHGWSVTERTS